LAQGGYNRDKGDTGDKTTKLRVPKGHKKGIFWNLESGIKLFHIPFIPFIPEKKQFKFFEI
jgi:hypothetical protein